MSVLSFWNGLHKSFTINNHWIKKLQIIVFCLFCSIYYFHLRSKLGYILHRPHAEVTLRALKKYTKYATILHCWVAYYANNSSQAQIFCHHATTKEGRVREILGTSLLKRCPRSLSGAKAFTFHLYVFSGRALFYIRHKSRLILIQVFAYCWQGTMNFCFQWGYTSFTKYCLHHLLQNVDILSIANRYFAKFWNLRRRSKLNAPWLPVLYFSHISK